MTGDFIVAILGYGDPLQADALTESLIDQGLAPARILLLLNPDSQPRRYADSARRRHLFEHNLGYAAAMNRAFVEAEADGARFVVLLTHDVKIDVLALEALVEDMRAEATLAAVGPLLHRRIEGGTIELFSAGGVEERRGRVAHTLDVPATVADRAWLDGSVLAIRTAAAIAIGGFDERYFLYVEDVDLCLRLRRAGWRVAVDGRVSAQSEPAGSKRSAAFEYLVRRNLLETHFKAAHYQTMMSFLFSALRMPRRGAQTVPAVRGVIDFISRRFGPPPARLLRRSDISGAVRK